MKQIAQLQLDWPAWRLSFSEYGELKGYDLSQTESACDYFDHVRNDPKLKRDYYPAPDELRDDYINDNGSFLGEDE